VRDFVAAGYTRPFLRLSESARREFVLALAERGIGGGSEYRHADPVGRVKRRKEARSELD